MRFIQLLTVLYFYIFVNVAYADVFKFSCDLAKDSLEEFDEGKIIVSAKNIGPASYQYTIGSIKLMDLEEESEVLGKIYIRSYEEHSFWGIDLMGLSGCRFNERNRVSDEGFSFSLSSGRCLLGDDETLLARLSIHNSTNPDRKDPEIKYTLFKNNGDVIKRSLSLRNCEAI